MPVFVRDELDEVALEVSAPTPALLLLADMMAPGWTAEIDGRRVPVLTADLVLRAPGNRRAGEPDIRTMG